MKYIYTAVFSQDGNKVIATVPDLPGCTTSGRDLDDAIAMVTDAASMYLVFAEDNDLDIAPATNQADILKEDGDILSLIQVDTIEYRALTDTKAVRKNVSLPQWMATLADKRGINCSQVLQAGLLQQLNSR